MPQRPAAASLTRTVDAVFIDALYQEIERTGSVPEFAWLEIAPLYIDRPTFAFRGEKQVVLQLNIFGYPDPKGTRETVAPLLEAAASTADRYRVPLSGIEIVFHRRRAFNPMQVWAATPPWGDNQIFQTPLSAEQIEATDLLKPVSN